MRLVAYGLPERRAQTAEMSIESVVSIERLSKNYVFDSLKRRHGLRFVSEKENQEGKRHENDWFYRRGQYGKGNLP